MANWTDVAKVEEIPPGTWKTLYLNEELIAVINLEGEFYAIQDRCTHDNGILTGGEIEGDQIICPRHGAAFCIKTGEVTCPPAYEDILTFPTRVVDDTVQVRDPREV